MIVKLISSLEKCFLDDDISKKKEYTRGSCFGNEIFRFCVCYTSEEVFNSRRTVIPKVESPLADCIALRRVEQVPVQMPIFNHMYDEDYLRTTPGLYPDILLPLSESPRLILTHNLHCLWVEVSPDSNFDGGEYPITISFTDAEDGSAVGSATFTLEIIDAKLPEQDLSFTQWFYCDCLADYYRVEAFSDRHFEIIENFLRTAHKNGINMILTPVFTPPLDTAVGGERTTVQLVDVYLVDGVYRFDFAKLGRWIDICKSVGIHQFEMAHFFTQWGAKHAPKIVATVDGEKKRIFGWDTEAAGEEYSAFLSSFIPELLAFLKSRGVDQNCVFHISDEPTAEQKESYLAARNVVRHLLEGYTVMDALSDYELYAEGIVDKPIPGTDHIEAFVENGVEDLWTYYCCSQSGIVSNRYIAMPSYRNRIIGMQFYKYDIRGFLQWGYNYYNDQYSYSHVNPYLSTDGEYFSPAGDAFSVYPAPDGTAFESLRIGVFHDALQDMRAFKLCEKLCGRDFVMGLIEPCGKELTFKEYPKSEEFVLSVREAVNLAIKNALTN